MEPITHNKNKACDFCLSEEGQLRMIGNYTVSLVEVEIDGQPKLACQSCRIKNNNLRKILGLRTSYKIVEPTRKKRSLLHFGFK